MSYYELEIITHSESGSWTTRSLKGRYEDKADALAAAVDYGQELAGPLLDGYRRPTVTIIFDDVLGATVKVGTGADDAEYHLVYALELGREVARAENTGRGYVACKL